MRSGRFSKDCGLLCGYARRQLGSDTDRDKNACVWRWPDHNCSLSGGANEDCNPVFQCWFGRVFQSGFHRPQSACSRVWGTPPNDQKTHYPRVCWADCLPLKNASSEQAGCLSGQIGTAFLNPTNLRLDCNKTIRRTPKDSNFGCSPDSASQIFNCN